VTITIDQLIIGMTVELKRCFSIEDMQAFSMLSPDRAPLHHDLNFAKQRGYLDVVVFGLLVAAPFSGILGNQLPGPLTVMHTMKFGMSAPVYIGEEIFYRAEVRQVSRATGAVVMDLIARRTINGDVVLKGQAQCGFKI
jgi:acyl dehydratase